MSVIESISLGRPKGPKCPESWWATPGQTREQFFERWQQRLPAMKLEKQPAYGRTDGVDAQ
jgi:hypothetical protein